MQVLELRQKPNKMPLMHVSIQSNDLALMIEPTQMSEYDGRKGIPKNKFENAW